MKQRTAIIGALVSILPMGQSLVIGGGAALTSAAVMLSVPERAMADSAEFYNTRGNEKGDSGDTYGAISDFTKAIEKNPNYDSAYVNRGATKFKLKDYYGAIADYNKAIEINPSDATYYTVRGWIRYQLGDIKRACSDLRKGAYMGDETGAKGVERLCQ